MASPPPPPPPPPPSRLITDASRRRDSKLETKSDSKSDSKSKSKEDVLSDLSKGKGHDKRSSKRFSKQRTDSTPTPPATPPPPTSSNNQKVVTTTATEGHQELLKEIEKGVSLKKKRGAGLRSDSFPKLKGTLRSTRTKERSVENLDVTKPRSQSGAAHPLSEPHDAEDTDDSQSVTSLGENAENEFEKMDVEIWGHIQLNVAEARSSTPIQDAFVEVDVGLNRLTTTKQLGSKTEPFWGTDFSVDLKGGLKSAITFTLWSGLPDRKGMVVAQALFPGVKDGDSLDGFFPMYSLKQLKDSYITGSVHLQLKHTASSEFPGKKNLYFKIFNAQMLSYRNAQGFSDPYLKISVGEESKKTKVVKKSVNPPWHQDFEFLGVDESEATLSVWHWEKISSHGFLGQAKVDAENFEPGVWNDMWLNLGSKEKEEKDKKGPSSADIRIRMRYLEELVLPISEYSDLLEVLMGHDMSAIHAIGTAVQKKENFAKTLINLHDSEERALQFVQDLLAYEIDTISSPDVIFRANSIGSKTLDCYLKVVGMSYLKETLGPIISDVYTEKRACEVDPTRTDKEKAQRNLCNLLYYSEKVVAGILNSLPNCPGTFKKVFHSLKMKVREKGWDESVEYTVVSGFLFLRFFCAAILGPKLFDLYPEHPDQNTARTLTLVSKVVQNLANLVDFGQKEPYMKDMNAYLLTKFEAMKKFLKAVSTPPANDPLPQTPMVAVAKEASHAYHLCLESKESLKQVESLDFFVFLLDILEGKISKCSQIQKQTTSAVARKAVPNDVDLNLNVPTEVNEWRSKLAESNQTDHQISKPQVMTSSETSHLSQMNKSKLEMQIQASVPLAEGREFVSKLMSHDSQLVETFLSWFPPDYQPLLKPTKHLGQ